MDIAKRKLGFTYAVCMQLLIVEIVLSPKRDWQLAAHKRTVAG